MVLLHFLIDLLPATLRFWSLAEILAKASLGSIEDLFGEFTIGAAGKDVEDAMGSGEPIQDHGSAGRDLHLNCGW